jgi:hypothetical protein
VEHHHVDDRSQFEFDIRAMQYRCGRRDNSHLSTLAASEIAMIGASEMTDRDHAWRYLMAARTPALRLDVAAVACSRYRKTRYIDTLARFCSHNARAKDPSACTSNHIARCTDEHKA